MPRLSVRSSSVESDIHGMLTPPQVLEGAGAVSAPLAALVVARGLVPALAASPGKAPRPTPRPQPLSPACTSYDCLECPSQGAKDSVRFGQDISLAMKQMAELV